MKDYNFFSVFEQKQSSRGTQIAKAALAALLVVALVAGAYIWLTVKYNDTVAQTDEINEFLASPSAQAAMQQADEYSNNISALNRYKNMIDEAAKNLELGHLFSSRVMDDIASALPSGAQIFTLNVQPDGALIMVVSVPDLATAARLTDAIDNLACTRDISVGTAIYLETSRTYTVTLNAYLTGGEEQ